MPGPLDLLMRSIRESPGKHQRGQWYDAVVVAVEGVHVFVRAFEALSEAEIEGPLLAPMGATGMLRVGQRVRVDWRYGMGEIVIPPDVDQRTALSIVGEDLRTEETTSHTDWVTLLDVDGLQIQPGVPFGISLHAEVIPVGGTGGTAKQVALLFNGNYAINYELSSSAGTFWLPFDVSSYGAGLSTPGRVVLLHTTSVPAPIALPRDTITRVSVQARTNDTGEGNDRVLVTELVVSL